jgi:hypothetical protein
MRPTKRSDFQLLKCEYWSDCELAGTAVSSAAKRRCAVVCATEKTSPATLSSNGRLGFRPSNSGCLHLRLDCSRYLARQRLQSLKPVSEAFAFHITSSLLAKWAIVL